MKTILVSLFILLSYQSSFARTLKFLDCTENQIDTVMTILKKTEPFVEAALHEYIYHDYFASFSLNEIEQVLERINNSGIYVQCKTKPKNQNILVSSRSRGSFNKQEKVILFPGFFDERVVPPEARRFATTGYKMCKQSRYFWQAFFSAELDYDPPVRRSSGKYVRIYDASWTGGSSVEKLCMRHYRNKET